ncbi:MAG: GatB/YqeY domain-containing protein [Candidatus Omnitrophica bacterium]|nr:GatB/YqeY domain-containing protein [Candidatus Omnitrophota bacterium]
MLADKINSDYIQAMKDRDKVRSGALNFLKSQLKYAMIDKRADKLDDSDVLTVIKKQIKQREDSIEQFKNGGRGDLVDKETSELNVLKSYLPQMMSENDVKAIIESVIKETQATSVKDMGKVMKEVLAKAQGKADNKMVSELVKQFLTSVG